MASHQKKMNVLRVGAALGLACAGGLLFLLQASFPVRALGLILIMSSALVSKPQLLGYYWNQKLVGFKRSWPIGVPIIASVALSFYFLHLDAVSGGNQVFPVIWFAASGLAAMGYILYLNVAK